MKRLIGAILILMFSVIVYAQPSNLKENHSDLYVVEKGDTLWSISEKFLKDPEIWKEIWGNNNQIKNPHKIYPGDVLKVIYVDGKPQLSINDHAHPHPHPHPHPHEEPASSDQGSPSSAIPMIPLDVINTFLTANRIVTKKTSKTAPYIVAMESKRVIAGKGDKVFARGTFLGNEYYSIYRTATHIEDPETKYSLGLEAKHIGNARVLSYQNGLAELEIRSSTQEVKAGDFLLPQRKPIDMSSYYPSVPERFVEGQVASIHDAASQAGRWQVVIINRGFKHGLKPGNVLLVEKNSRVMTDPRYGDKIRIPGSPLGEIIIFRVFGHMSYALVMRVEKTLNINDRVYSAK